MEKIAERLRPHVDSVFSRLGTNEPLEDLAREFAGKYGVTPGQVLIFVHRVAQAARQNAANHRSTGGFPIMPPSPTRLPPPLPAIPMEDSNAH